MTVGWPMTSVQENFPNLPGYRVEAQLGQGGMASVFLARKTGTNEPVAIKLLLKKFAADPDFQKRFLREADFIARLQHHNIIRVLSIESDDENLFIVMEYVGGGDLRAHIARGLSIDASLAILQQLADALTVAHKHSITHRDIKPSNVLFREDGTVVLADFGIAKAANQDTNLTLTGMIPGTPRYMSPEQARSRPVDGRSDYYSLGILLFEMLTGSAPFVGTDPVSTALMHITEPIPQLDGPAAHLQPLLEQLLVKDPEQRISCSSELRASIDRCRGSDATEFLALDSTEFITANRLAALWHGLWQQKYARGGLLMAFFAATAALALPGYFDRVQDDPPLDVAFIPAKQQGNTPLTAFKVELERKQPEVALAADSQAEPTRARKVEENSPDASPAGSLSDAVGLQQPLQEIEASYQPDSPAAQSGAASLASLSLFEEPENESQLEELYERGTAQLVQNKLTQPRDDNALQTFKTMLTIDAGDARATNGIAAIADRYASLAKQRKSEDIEGAIDLLDRGLQVDAQNKNLLALRQRLVKELSERPTNRKVERLLARAERQIKAGKYARPSGDNAHESLQAAASYAPQDKRVTQGFEQLLRRVSAQARQQQQAENWQAALMYVEDALRIAPEDAALVARKEKITVLLQQATQPADETVEEEASAPEEQPKKRKRRIIGNF